MAEYGGCRACRHWFHGVYIDEIPTCRAFPEGIPLMIVVGNIEHTKPLTDQDNTIVYEPAEAAKQAVPKDKIGAGRRITVSMRVDVAGYEQFRSIGTIDLERVSGINSSLEELYSNIRKIGYGTEGLETFYLNLPEELRGKAALLKFEINDGTVYLDDISFGKKWEPSMTLAEAEEYTKNSYYSGRVLYHGTNPDRAASIANGGVNPARLVSGFLGEGFYVTNKEERAKDFSKDEKGNQRQGPILKTVLNIKNPRVYPGLQEFFDEAKIYGQATGRQGSDAIDRYTEYLRSQGYDAIVTTPEFMQYYLVFDPKQVVVVKE